MRCSPVSLGASVLRKSAADAVKRLPLVARREAAFAPDVGHLRSTASKAGPRSGHLAAFRRAGTGKLSLAASAGDSEFPQPSSEEKLSWLMEGKVQPSVRQPDSPPSSSSPNLRINTF